MQSTPLKNKVEKAAKLAEDKNGSPHCEIYFPFNPDDLSKIRSLTGRKYIPERKCWICPVSIDNLQNLDKWGFVLDNELSRILVKRTATVEQFKKIKIPGLKGKLRDFQESGVSFIDAKEGRCLLADDMGLGKTVQALAYLQLHPEIRPVIIALPVSLKLNWEKEAKAWLSDPDVELLSGRTPYKTHAKILIINYDILDGWADYIIRVIKPRALIMDEVHCIKNGKAKRTKAAKKIGKKVEHIIAISGTPVLNRPIEIYNAVTMINPMILGNYWSFTKRYCDAKTTMFGTDVSGASNTDELHRKLVSTIMLRRLKEDVLPELPDKQTCIVPVELDNFAEYKRAEKDFIKYVAETKGTAAAISASNAEMLGKINLLKQLSVKGKMKEVIEWIYNYLESGEKLVLFCTHTATIDVLMKEFPKIALRYDGQVSTSKRQEAVELFQNSNKYKLFIGMLDVQGKPAGVGLTLTAARCTATIEFQYTPGVHDQADDRVHRIGQKRAVINYKFIAQGTIEDKLIRLLDKKRRTVDMIVDGRETDKESLLTELIKEYQVA